MIIRGIWRLVCGAFMIPQNGRTKITSTVNHPDQLIRHSDILGDDPVLILQRVSIPTNVQF